MHFAALVITSDKPTKDVLALALAPWGPQAGKNARWDWYALGGRYHGMLNATCTTNFIMGDLEYPDDEPDLRPWLDRQQGVDALRKRDQHSFAVYVPRVVVFHDWHETAPFAWRNQGKDHGCPFLSDLDASAPVLHDEEGYERAGCWWEQFYEIVGRVPDDHWMSIVDCRAPRGSAIGQAASNETTKGTTATKAAEGSLANLDSITALVGDI